MTGMFWNDSEEDYLVFYAHTYDTVKSISKKLQLGGPAACNLTNVKDWLSRYFEYCKTKNCLPDFFSFHFYIHNSGLDEIQKSYFSDSNRITLSKDADYLHRMVELITEVASVYHFNSNSIHLTEWNASPSHRDLSHDTVFMASFLVKNILENMDAVSSLGYWTITDFIEEFPLPQECFHGGMGVLTANGIKKAGYHAFSFLHLLGTNKISSGPGYYITSDERGYQILLYHYCHFDPLYCSMDHSGISHTDRYGIFKDNINKNMQITLTGFREAPYKIIDRSVSRSHGSAFDTWITMGAPENITQEHLEYLKSKSIPDYHEITEVIQNTYNLQRCLTPHEIQLIEIRRA